MSEQIIITLITAGLPVLATTITALAQRRTNSRNAAKDSILQMIVEDKMDVLYNELPQNYQNILHEYDIYHKNGGNSYVTEKVEDYKRWFAHVQVEMLDKKKKV